MIEIDVEARSTASPERVWALLADARSWTRWAGFDDVQVEGDQGVGQIRHNRRGRITGATASSYSRTLTKRNACLSGCTNQMLGQIPANKPRFARLRRAQGREP
jgi:3-mercaptopyruvate sulfurtransferase SseA